MTREADIQSLITRCANQDRRAQMEVYKRYARSMYQVAMRYCADQQEAEDQMQEGFISAFQNLHHYRGEASFGVWLKRIVINRCLDAIQKRQLLLEPLDEAKVEVPEEHATAVDFDLGKIRETLADMPEGYRVILSLYLLEGYDHEEIGQILEISPSTSRSQYARAKKQLRERLIHPSHVRPV